MKLWQKGLIGCAIGCGVLGVAAVVTFFGGLYWVFAPGEQVATERIVGEESVGAVQLDPVREDPGARAFVDALIRRFEARQREQQRAELPESLRWTQSLGGGQGSGLSWLVPRDATLTLERVEGLAAPQPVLAVNLATFPRAFRWMLTRAAQDAEPAPEAAADPRILTLASTHVAFYESTLLVASQPEALAGVLKRLDREAGNGAAEEGSAPAAGRLLRFADRERFDLYGTINNQDYYLEDYLADLDAEWQRDLPPGGLSALKSVRLPVAHELLQVRFGVDLISADRGFVAIEVACASASGAQAWASALADRLRLHAAAKLAGRGVRAEVRSSSSGTTGRVEADVEGLAGWQDELVERLLRQPR